MSKNFKQGDIVICIENSHSGYFPGEQGRVYEVDHSRAGLKLVGEAGTGLSSRRFELYRPTFNVGDRVEFRQDYGVHAKLGDAGTVSELDTSEPEETIYVVQMDDGSERRCFGMRLIPTTKQKPVPVPALPFKVGDKLEYLGGCRWLGGKGIKVGDVLTVDLSCFGDFLTTRAMVGFAELRTAAPSHRRFVTNDAGTPRFKLHVPTQKFAVGDKVELVDQKSYSDYWTGAMHVVHIYSDGLVECDHPKLGFGGFYAGELQAHVASSAFELGARVVITEDHDGEDEGAAGEVVSFFKGSPVVRFDESGDEVVCEDYQLMPEPVVVREFRILTQYGVGTVSYPSEDDAVNAHMAPGFAAPYAGNEFEVVEITRVAKFKVEAQPNIAVRAEEAA